MDQAELKIRTKQFALRILKLTAALPPTPEARAIRNQLSRSGTSVGANYRAVCRARSKAEFISKIGIVIEEADESCFWMELIIEGGMLPEEKVSALLHEANELTAIMTASRKTAQDHQQGHC
ncbi:MAG: four helix bundle protein [Pontiellaceae bacterium]|nr:four helix bundle protein [Pontiellaceae bacterium]MBN2786615.1 four helix bundle protein [Pontiellaceae bacterium]